MCEDHYIERIEIFQARESGQSPVDGVVEEEPGASDATEEPLPLDVGDVIGPSTPK